MISTSILSSTNKNMYDNYFEEASGFLSYLHKKDKNNNKPTLKG